MNTIQIVKQILAQDTIDLIGRDISENWQKETVGHQYLSI